MPASPCTSTSAPLDAIEEKMLTLRPESRRKVLGVNAAKLYRLQRVRGRGDR